MFSKSMILFQTIEIDKTVELSDHRKMLKRYKDIGRKNVKYCQKRKMWSNNVFVAHT